MIISFNTTLCSKSEFHTCHDQWPQGFTCRYGYIWKNIGYCFSNSSSSTLRYSFLINSAHRKITPSKKIQIYTKRVNTGFQSLCIKTIMSWKH